MKHVLYSLALLALTASCHSGDTAGRPAESDTGNVAPVTIVRLDSLALVPDSLSAGMPGVAVWMAMSGAEALSPAEFAASRRISAFIPDATKEFGNTDSLARNLGLAFSRLDMAPRRVYTIVSPYMQSVVLSGDTAVFVALNHYLGENHRAYSGFPAYLRRTKTPARIMPDITEALMAESHPYSAPSATALSRMLYDGAILEGIMRATGISESQALGYSPEQIRWADDNLAQAWDALLQRKLLFSTDPSVAERLVNPAPATTILNPDSPGRLGRLIGHRIVLAYLSSHPDTPLSLLLSPDFYAGQNTLAESGFSPR